MKNITEYIYEGKNDSFIKTIEDKVKELMKDDNELYSSFYNDFNEKDFDAKENQEINKYINSILPGEWAIVGLTGNYTDFGIGVFYERTHDVIMELQCLDDGDAEYIDTCDVYSAKHFNPGPDFKYIKQFINKFKKSKE